MSLPSPNTNNYAIAKGEFAFRRDGETHYKHLGNVSEASYTPNVEMLDHYSAMAGVKAKDKSVPVQIGASVSMTLDEPTARNLAMAVLGDRAAFTQDAALAETQTFTGIAAGDVLDLGVTDVTIGGVTDGGDPAVDFAEGTHYVADPAAGTVRIVALPEGAAASLEVTYDQAAVETSENRDVIAALMNTQVEGHLMVTGTGEHGPRYKFTDMKISIQPGESVSLVSDEWQQLSLNAELLRDVNNPAHPFGKIEELKNA